MSGLVPSYWHKAPKSESRLVMSDSVTPWTVAGFSRPEYWRRLPCPPPGGLPDPGIKPRSPALQVGSLSAEPLGRLLKSLDSLGDERDGYLLC